MGKVRLADIAKKVGVSTVTVHNALAGNKGVSEELREKIQSVASEMGYQILSERKQKAREAAGEASYTVGVLIAENYLAQYETFYWKMYQELAVAATEKRCVAAVEILRKEDERNTLKLPACVKGNKVDGLIVLGKINKEYIVKLTETAIVTDNFYGTYLLTEFMFEQGIEELGFVGSIYSTSSIMDRYCGFLKSMMSHKKEVKQQWVIEDRDELGQMGFKLPKRLPKGFVCNCDLAAYMLIDKLTERGYKVPEDVSVVGFNNYLYPELADREITTYEVNIKAMVKVALEKVLKQIKNPKRGHGMDIVSGHMVIKKSVKLK